MKKKDEIKKEPIEELMKNHRWKNRNEMYLFELQKFMDLADNIENENLKRQIINQVIRLDKCITEVSEELIERIREVYKQ